MSRFQATTYDVGKTSGTCALTGKVFDPGEHYIATLVEDGDDLHRVDVSEAAWEQGQKPDGLFSNWKAVAPQAAEEKKKLFVDDEVLMNLLERLSDAQQPQRIAFRFVLALILMRKKLLRYDGTEQSQPENQAASQPESQTDEHAAPVHTNHWVLTPKLDLSKGPLGKWDASRTFKIIDPGLDEAGIMSVTDQLSDILQAEL